MGTTEAEPGSSGGNGPLPLPARLRADLTGALKQRDVLTVSVLRTTLAAIANAEAPPVGAVAPASGPGLHEHPRLVLSTDDIEAIVRHEIADRDHTIGLYAAAGRHEPAAALRAEIAILERYLA